MTFVNAESVHRQRRRLSSIVCFSVWRPEVRALCCTVVAVGASCRQLPPATLPPPAAPSVSTPVNNTAAEVQPNHSALTAAAQPRTQREIADCLRTHALTPHALAVTWPSRIGHQVVLDAEIVRALDFAQLLVRAGSEHFLVMATPAAVGEGEKPKLFSVIGVATGKIAHGPQRLAQLMLIDDAECEYAEQGQVP